jgi:tetratricopeptide (TPR) repeat protein
VLPVAAAILAATLALPAAPLTEPGRLSVIYDLILDARFDEAASEAARACPPAPPVACELLGVTGLWWRIQLDPDSTALDGEFSRRVDAVIAAAEAWTAREPGRAEAWFYLGGAYGARSQWRVLRVERLAAARDGKRIKEALERALALDPQLHDARFGIGLYKYYADVAPAVARFLRFLLLLPGGNKAEGLREMVAARDHGALLQGEADYQLHWVYFWYEGKPALGLHMLEALHRRYPGNPLFLQRIGEVQVEYFHDPTASLAAWQQLVAGALGGAVREPRLALTRGRLGAAEQLDALAETDRAIELLSALAADRSPVPHGVLARGLVALGRAYDRMGRRAEAVAAYQSALAAPAPRDGGATFGTARAALRRTPDARAAEAYRLSIEGWRAAERVAYAEAERLLDRSLAGAPGDPVTWYRRGHVHARRQQADAALAAFGRVASAGASAPPVYRARALLERAQILEARHDRAGALESYRAASYVFGADGRTRADARRAVARLTAK